MALFMQSIALVRLLLLLLAHPALSQPRDAGKLWEVFHAHHSEGKGSHITADDRPAGTPTAADMAESVKEGFLHAWTTYRTNAWGNDEIKPSTGQGFNNWGGTGALILDSLDTMILMGLTEEVQAAKEKVKEMQFKNINKDLSVFELNIRYIGGLLAAHGLSGDRVFLDKAKELADLLLPAFQTPTRFPKTYMNIHKGKSHSAGWLGAANTILADIGTLQMEWVYLSHHLGDPRYANLVLDISDRIAGATLPEKGMYPTIISYNNAIFGGSRVNWGAMGDSYYEYLLKFYLLSGRNSQKFLELYLQSVEALKQNLVAAVAVEYPDSNGNTVRKNMAFMAQMKARQKIKVQDHLACFTPGLLALGAHAFHSDENPKDPDWAKREPNTDAERLLRDRAEEDMLLADELLEGCVQTYLVNSMGLGADVVDFKPEVKPWSLQDNAHTMPPMQIQSHRHIWNNVFNTHKEFSGYLLRPETVESLFVMWRVTGDKKYREYGWKIWQAIERWCKTNHAYSAVKKTDFNMPKKNELDFPAEASTDRQPSVFWEDKMETFFLAETIKYLYLLFLDEDKLPIHQYIFNTEAHPLPVFLYTRQNARFSGEEIKTGVVRPWDPKFNDEIQVYDVDPEKPNQVSKPAPKQVQTFGPPNKNGKNHYVFPGSSNYPGGTESLPEHKIALCVSDEEKVNTRCCYDGPCSESGWTDNGLGDPNICGGSDEAGQPCSGRVPWNEAEQHCNKMQGRLCSTRELERYEAMGTGCLYDIELVWSSTPCEAPSEAVKTPEQTEQTVEDPTKKKKKKTKNKKKKVVEENKEEEEEGGEEEEEEEEEDEELEGTAKLLREQLKEMQEKLDSLKTSRKKNRRNKKQENNDE
eukprot:gb/GEZN01001520.1/.p1 GENE.gb/GEZN01001520.1/~~gb/GEZN01001520.1/.p1  ORF type:complete len:866 (-),score=115.45 gb/GEZN01001520.1/:257-2854(-)